MHDFCFDTLIFDNSAPLADRLNACKRKLEELDRLCMVPMYKCWFDYQRKIIIDKMEELLNDNK